MLGHPQAPVSWLPFLSASAKDIIQLLGSSLMPSALGSRRQRRSERPKCWFLRFTTEDAVSQADASCSQANADQHTDTDRLFFSFLISLKGHPLPLKSPSLSALCVPDVSYRQSSSSLRENETAPCCCYPKGLASQTHSSDRGQDSGEGNTQRNSLKRFGWDYLVLGPTGLVATSLIPMGALLFSPLSTDKTAQAFPYSWHFSGCPHTVPRCLNSHRAYAQDFCIQFAFKQCDYYLDLF